MNPKIWCDKRGMWRAKVLDEHGKPLIAMSRPQPSKRAARYRLRKAANIIWMMGL